ncbi:MAG: DNA polymerase III subunit delta' [Methylococcales bacterium]
MEKALYPWLSDASQQLIAYIEAQRVPHALLFSGAAGLGKKQLAQLLAKRLLCESADKKLLACQFCQSCLLFEAGNHPDFYLIQPVDAGKPIVVDEIRQLNQNLKLLPQYNQNRVVIICLAEELNTSAANSFLKTLEEPGQRTIFLLVSNTPSAVMPTILTRCQQIRIPLPQIDRVIQWLSESQQIENARALATFSGGAPLYALELNTNGDYENKLTVLQLFVETQFKDFAEISITESWIKYSAEFVIYILITGLLDMIRLAMDPEVHINSLYHPDQNQELSRSAELVSVKSLFKFLTQVYRAKQLLASQVNMQLVYEGFFIQWRSMLDNE